MTYLINTQIGFFIVNADNETKALIEYWTKEQPLEYCLLDREHLLEMGYQTIEPTPIKNVFRIYK